MRYIIIIAFGILVAAQWYVPGNMIFSQEKILKEGRQVKFFTAPIDPADPFRGNYIFLSFKENSVVQPKSSELNPGDKIYVVLKTDGRNYATATGISKKKPSAGTLFVEAEVDYISSDANKDFVYIKYPFEKFYMEEFKAPRAEQAYSESRTDSSQKAYALVSILDGRSVVKNVYINDTAIADILRFRR